MKSFVIAALSLALWTSTAHSGSIICTYMYSKLPTYWIERSSSKIKLSALNTIVKDIKILTRAPKVRSSRLFQKIDQLKASNEKLFNMFSKIAEETSLIDLNESNIMGKVLERIEIEQSNERIASWYSGNFGTRAFFVLAAHGVTVPPQYLTDDYIKLHYERVGSYLKMYRAAIADPTLQNFLNLYAANRDYYLEIGKLAIQAVEADDTERLESLAEAFRNVRHDLHYNHLYSGSLAYFAFVNNKPRTLRWMLANHFQFDAPFGKSLKEALLTVNGDTRKIAEDQFELDYQSLVNINEHEGHGLEVLQFAHRERLEIALLRVIRERPAALQVLLKDPYFLDEGIYKKDLFNWALADPNATQKFIELMIDVKAPLGDTAKAKKLSEKILPQDFKEKVQAYIAEVQKADEERRERMNRLFPSRVGNTYNYDATSSMTSTTDMIQMFFNTGVFN